MYRFETDGSENTEPSFYKVSHSKLCYHEKHPDEPVKIGFLPSSIWYVFQFAQEYDFAYGERFYDLTWNHGLTHEQILSDIDVPCVYIHAKENTAEDGT